MLTYFQSTVGKLSWLEADQIIIADYAVTAHDNLSYFKLFAERGLDLIGQKKATK